MLPCMLDFTVVDRKAKRVLRIWRIVGGNRTKTISAADRMSIILGVERETNLESVR